MTSPTTLSPAPGNSAPGPLKATASPAGCCTGWTVTRLAFSLALVAAYYAFREPVVEALNGLYAPLYERLWGRPLGTDSPMAVLLVTAVLGVLVFTWRRLLAADPRFHAPLLVTTILVLSDAGWGVLENHSSPFLAWLTNGHVTSFSPTFVAIATAVVAELLLGRFYWGKWPHLASAYVSGISAGILVKSPYLWPFVVATLLAISSKYVLRIGKRHLWNPTNFGITMLLFLAPQYAASLSVQAGNTLWALVVIWGLGALILYRLGLLHISLSFVAAFIPLAFLRSWFTGHPWQAELAPLTSPMFQLYICFMITDPKTITRRRWSQVLVAVCVAVAETLFRLVEQDVLSFYHALFVVGPAANLIEIVYDRLHTAEQAAKQPVAAGAPAPVAPEGITTPGAVAVAK